jgi:hypothetical protein
MEQIHLRIREKICCAMQKKRITVSRMTMRDNMSVETGNPHRCYRSARNKFQTVTIFYPYAKRN